MEKIVFETVEKLSPEFEEVSKFIFDHPELGDKEYISSKYLVDKIAEHGFEVQYPYCDIDTAFRNADFKEETIISMIMAIDILGIS